MMDTTPVAAAPAGAGHRLFDTMHGLPVRPSAAASPAARPSSAGPPPLASLLVRSGTLKGTRLPIRVPVVNIGRADYNDVVIPEESVSTAHAKLQRREEVWVLTDLGSTNGTLVDGERIAGETVLSPGASLRFGEVSVMFEPTDDTAGVSTGSGTKVMSAMGAKPAPPPAPPASPPPPRAAAEPAPAPRPPAAADPNPATAPTVRPAHRKPVVVASPSAEKGIPKWVVPVAVAAILAVLAAILLTK